MGGMNRVPQLDSVDLVYTGINESTKQFYHTVSLEHIRDYIVHGETVDNYNKKRVDKLYVENMPIGNDEVYTGLLYLKYPVGDSKIDYLHESFVYYAQFDISIPRCAFDDQCLIMEGIPGDVVVYSDDYRNGVFDKIESDATALDSLLNDIALFIVSGCMDFGLQNIIVSGNTYHFIEFNTHRGFSNPFSMLTQIPSYFTKSINLRYPYAIVTSRAHDMAWWILIHEDELYVPSHVIETCYRIIVEFPIGHGEFICGTADPWNPDEFIIHYQEEYPRL